MLRFKIALVVGLLLLPVGAASAQSRRDRAMSARELTHAGDDGHIRVDRGLSAIRSLLLKHVDSVNWEEKSFSEVLDWLREQSAEGQKVNVVVQWRALSIESVDEDTFVSLKMEDTTVAEVLNETLDQLSDVDPLTYIGINNKLKISTKTDFDRRLFVRIYNIDDIFFEIRNFRGSPQINLNQQQQGGGGGGGAGGVAQVQSIFGQSGGGGNQDNDDNEDQDEERGDEIIEWIQTTVLPDSWQDNGGLGTMAVMNKMLTVRNTLEVHEIIGGPFDINE